MVAKRMLARMLAAALVALALVPALAATAMADEVVTIGGVKYTLHEDGDNAWATVSRSPNTPGSVTIPGEVEHDEKSYTVTAIGEGAFEYCRSLGSVGIPASVTSIGVRAFVYCTGLSKVAFAGESRLVSIGDFAFYNCSAISSVTIPAGEGLKPWLSSISRASSKSSTFMRIVIISCFAFSLLTMST